MNCTAELYCAGKCVGDTLWYCGPTMDTNIVVITMGLAALAIVFYPDVQAWWKEAFGR